MIGRKAYTYAGIILAGGQSIRYGKPKALETIQGTPFYEKSIQALDPLVEKSVLVAHPSLLKNIPDLGQVEVITDDPTYFAEGPLAGIYSGMNKLHATHYLVLACDMPLIDTEILRLLQTISQLVDMDTSVIPNVDNRLQPLVAIYPSLVKPKIENLLRHQSRRLTTLLNQTNSIQIEFTSADTVQCFQNINTPQDYDGIQHRFI